MRIHSSPFEISSFPSINADATNDGCRAATMHEAVKITDLLTNASAWCEISLRDRIDYVNIKSALMKWFKTKSYLDLEYLLLNISRREGASADASGCIATHFIQTPSM